MGLYPSISTREIAFNKTYQPANGMQYLGEVLASGRTGGNGPFTQKCHAWFAEYLDFKHSLLTTSCTDALEMAALLLNIGEGDEVIVPSYNFPSAANAFLLRGATVKYVESSDNHPVMDAEAFAEAIGPHTKAVVLMHYAGYPGELQKLLALAKEHRLAVVEDAAHALGGTYQGQPLGTFGDFGCFSFHETKNISAGEGGLLLINNTRYLERAEEIWQMGTNRAAYQRGITGGYHWKGIGSSFLPSELTAAYLYAQLHEFEVIQQRRQHLWQRYYQHLRVLPRNILGLPATNDLVQNSAHIFYVILPTEKLRNNLQLKLAAARIQSAPHYHYLEHEALRQQGIEKLSQRSNDYERQLLRLPLYPGLSDQEQDRVVEVVKQFVEGLSS